MTLSKFNLKTPAFRHGVMSTEDRIMDFRPLATEERSKLMDALRGNADTGLSILMDRQTSFAARSSRAGKR